MNEDQIKSLSMQRDEIRDCLADLYARLVHGIHNGMLPERCPRRQNKDPNEKCENGKTRRDVQWCMGSCCKGCHPVGQCHLSIEEYDLFESMWKAREMVGLKDAEMPKIAPGDFAEFNPEAPAVKVTPRWVARNFYRFAVGYWAFSDHSDKDSETAWKNAFDSILCISFGDSGKALHRLLEMGDKSSPADEKTLKENPEFAEIFKRYSDFRTKGVKKFSNLDDKSKVHYLVSYAMALRFEYKFGHSYPGGDVDIYDGVFAGLIDMCLDIAGLVPVDAPKSYDFEDKEEYKRKKFEFNYDHKQKLYSFMNEVDPLTTVIA